jgi:cob(I)alamin adenosyltransferase
MGHRLSKIYTRTGDDGTTGLGDGSRVDKDSLRVEAFGTVDELNSQLGVVLSLPLAEEIRALLTGVQHDLFDLGGEISVPGRTLLDESYVTRLERELDKLNAQLAPLKEFILPGGTATAATCHLARAVCRRAERCVVALRRHEGVNSVVIHYLNRLSDLLFVAARFLNHAQGCCDVLWTPGRHRSSDM